jgi:hypothetical protein
MSRAKFGREVPVLSPTDAAWLAGLIDGEGSVLLSRSGKSYSPVITVGMTHEDTILHVHRLVPGSMIHRQQQAKGWKDAYCWTVGGRRAVALAMQLVPYAVTKREQLMLLMRFPTGNWRGKLPVPETVKDEREGIYDGLRVLNRKGVA